MVERRFRSFYIGALAVVAIGLLGTILVPKAHADSWDKTTTVVVNEPVIAGSRVLQPGTYVWKMLDSQSNRHIIQIFDRNQRHLESTALVVSNYRLQPVGKDQFTFWDTPAGVPKAVRAWFCPGDKFGQEFDYPKQLVTQLALNPRNKLMSRPVTEQAMAAAPEEQTASISTPNSLPDTATTSNAFVGLAGLGFLSLSVMISLFAKKSL